MIYFTLVSSESTTIQEGAEKKHFFLTITTLPLNSHINHMILPYLT